MKPILLFQKVQKKFGEFIALSDISFEVKQGEFVALLGPNGAGKTTLINCLAGMSNRDSGQILVKDQDPEKNPEFTKTLLGIVEQEITFDPFFTCIESLRIRRGLYGKKPNEKYLINLLKNLSLYDKKDSPGRALSGGMKRRLMIAKALAHEPKILILDEPTAGVDIELRANLYKFLQKLKKDGMTIVLTTHYLEEAEKLASRVIIQRKGTTLITQDIKELLKKAERICEITLQNNEKKTFKITPQKNISQIISPYTQDIIDIKIKEPKLEDIFLKITQK